MSEDRSAAEARSDHRAASEDQWVQASTVEEWDLRARGEGPDHVVADCGSAASHERRLQALLALPLVTGDRLEDLGCGAGRLCDLLPPGVDYDGLDWSEEMVRLARGRRPGGRFRVGGVDELVPADWVVASGPFNYARGWDKERTRQAVRRMWDNAARGVAVTFRSVPAEGRLDYTPGELLEYLDGCDWSVLHLDRSYLPNDVCLRAWRS